MWNCPRQLVPYVNGGGNTFSCSTCGIFTTGSFARWSADTLTIGLQGARVGSCSLAAETVTIHGVADTNSAGYFSGSLLIEGSTSPVCFYFSNGHFTLLADNSGRCPSANTPASCENTTPSHVSQVWTGDYH